MLVTRRFLNKSFKEFREDLKNDFLTKEDFRHELKQELKQELKKYATKEDVKKAVMDGVDIIKVQIESYRNDFKASVDAYKSHEPRISSLEGRVDLLEI